MAPENSLALRLTTEDHQEVVTDYIQRTKEIVNKSKKVKYIEKQVGDVDITYSNTEKAKKILNYFPKVPLDDGLLFTFEWEKKKLKIDS